MVLSSRAYPYHGLTHSHAAFGQWSNGKAKHSTGSYHHLSDLYNHSVAEWLKSRGMVLKLLYTKHLMKYRFCKWLRSQKIHREYLFCRRGSCTFFKGYCMLPVTHLFWTSLVTLPVKYPDKDDSPTTSRSTTGLVQLIWWQSARSGRQRAGTLPTADEWPKH